MQYTLLGSCATRDAAELGPDPLPRPAHYIARTTIQSLVSTPTSFRDRHLGDLSGWRAATVVGDFRKTHLATLSRLEHALIIDLIDERCRMLRTRHGIVTDSPYLRLSKLAKLRRFRRYRVVGKDWALEKDGPFATAASIFCAKIPDVPVVIHRALWSRRDADGCLLADAEDADRNNEWLKRAHDILQAGLPQAVSVEVPEEHRLADPNHKWGLAPYHYVTSYYSELARMVRRVLPLDDDQITVPAGSPSS